jgi:hypothetical protein
MINKEYFLSLLENGEDIDTICQEVTTMVNAAVAEYKAKQEAERIKQEAEAEKHAVMKRFCENIVELAKIYGVDIEVSDEDVTNLVKAYEVIFTNIKELKDNDDDILQAFLSTF